MSANCITIRKGLPVFITKEKPIRCYEGCSFDIVAGINNSYKGSGKLYATNYRLIFLKENPTTLFSSFNMPYILIRKYKIKKKMFGGQVISGYVAPITNGGLKDEGKFHIVFKSSDHASSIFKISEKEWKNSLNDPQRGHDIVTKAPQLPIQEIFPEQFPNYFKNRKKKRAKSVRNVINNNTNNNNIDNNTNNNNNEDVNKKTNKKNSKLSSPPNIVRHISVPMLSGKSDKFPDTDDDLDFDTFKESRSDNSNNFSPKKLAKRLSSSKLVVVSQSRNNAPLSLGKDKLTKEAKLFSQSNKKKSQGPVIGASPVDLTQWRKRQKKTVITDRPEEKKQPKIYSPPISGKEGVNEAYQDPNNPSDILLTVNNGIKPYEDQILKKSMSVPHGYNFNNDNNNGFEEPHHEPIDLDILDDIEISEIHSNTSKSKKNVFKDFNQNSDSSSDIFDDIFNKNRNNNHRQRSNSLKQNTFNNNNNNNKNNNKSPTLKKQVTVPVLLNSNNNDDLSDSDSDESDDRYHRSRILSSKYKSQGQPINQSIKNNTNNNNNNIKSNKKVKKSPKKKYKKHEKQFSTPLLDFEEDD